MTNNIVSVQIEDVRHKVLIFVGDEFDAGWLTGVKESLKRKGIETAGIILLPDNHYFVTASKEEAIANLKEIIKKLEEAT